VRYVATQSFTDESDGQWIEEGRTYVAHSSDVFRAHPECFEPSGRGSGPIIRDGGTAELVGKPRAPRRPAKQALPFGYSYKEVELVERGYADFSVDLGSGARETILDAISRTQREAGDVELGGWLFAQHRPRHDARSVCIAFATVIARGTHDSVSLGDPIDGIVAARSEGIGEPWALVGDFHCHTRGGSELPSMQDARAWAGTSDSLGRSAYVSLIVSPAESGGWMFPRFSAWVARRFGVPSRPVVQRARMDWE
jgi:hypothetical protein